VTDTNLISARVQQLAARLPRLEQRAALLQTAPLAGREWFELLRQKLIPQLGQDAFLVVAVVGGTNIGKSVIFNHLAGSRASASSPLASGTRQVTCLVPEGFVARQPLEAVFPDFQLREWSDAAQALQDSDAHQLFWRTERALPSSLLILDTPDIDSDARVNWLRADAVRRCADVLIAVLTQQKYNDAAVKEFFRKAGDEDKAVIVVFNQVVLPDDEEYWPLWLSTFCRETGITPEAVYLAPADRRAAEELRLPFLPRLFTPREPAAEEISVKCSLAAELSQLRFADIRLRTLRGSLREVLHPERGLPAWLGELSHAADELGRAAARLASDSLIEVDDWPVPPNSLFVSQIRKWWSERQHGWARVINSTYNAVGRGLLWPVRAARGALGATPTDPLADYRKAEWTAVLNVANRLFDSLQLMADSGSPLIRPRVEPLLHGAARETFVAELRTSHDAVDFAQELSEVVDAQLKSLQDERPDLFGFYRQLNHVSAAVRPVTSVVLFTIGFGPAGELVAPLVANAAAAAAVHVVADVAGGATAAIAGEAAVSGAAGSGAGLLQVWFHNVQSAFTARRAGWLTTQVNVRLLGTLPQELRSAIAIRDEAEFVAVSNLVRELSLQLESGTERGEADSLPSALQNFRT
jgi:hypothetical protein